MEEVITRHSMHMEKRDECVEHQPSPSLQRESITYAGLAKDFTEKSRELRQLNGEDLQELGMADLVKLEKMVEGGLSRIMRKKGDILLSEISALKKKEAKLMEENAQLKQRSEIAVQGGPHSSESVTNGCCFPDKLQDHYKSSDTSLKLGHSPSMIVKLSFDLFGLTFPGLRFEEGLKIAAAFASTYST
nr:MADS-box protein JOINTLESS-like isoform X1 [Ipomoea batatas]